MLLELCQLGLSFKDFPLQSLQGGLRLALTNLWLSSSCELGFYELRFKSVAQPLRAFVFALKGLCLGGVGILASLAKASAVNYSLLAP